MEVDTKSDNEDQESVTGGLEEASKKRKAVSASPVSGEKKTQANKRVKGIDDQAEESGDDEEENSEDGSGGEEEEDESNYVYNEFLVRDDENSDASDDDAGSQDEDRVKKPKKRDLKSLKKRKGDLQLDEEDLLLVQENNAAKTSRSSSSGSKARAAFDNDDDGEIAPIEGRMRSNTHDSDDYDQADGEGEEGVEGGSGADRHRAGARRPQSSFYNDDDEGSDMGGFIVDEDTDEEGAEGGEGKPRRRSGSGVDQDGRGARAEHQIPHRRTGGRRDGPTYDQFQDAMDIFGAGFDDFDDEDLEDGASNADEDGDSDAEGALEGRVTTDKLKKMDLAKDGDYLESIGEHIELSKKDKRRIQKLRNRYERSHLVATFCTERDDVLRRVDRPERLQEVLVGRDTPEEAERVLEARWMAAKLATKMVSDNHLTSSRETVRFTANPLAANRSALYFLQSNEEKEQRLREELEEPILHVLRFLQVR